VVDTNLDTGRQHPNFCMGASRSLQSCTTKFSSVLLSIIKKVSLKGRLKKDYLQKNDQIGSVVRIDVVDANLDSKKQTADQRKFFFAKNHFFIDKKS
jgi:hypothetical protein